VYKGEEGYYWEGEGRGDFSRPGRWEFEEGEGVGAWDLGMEDAAGF
jgi:hypothetical protein